MSTTESQASYQSVGARTTSDTSKCSVVERNARLWMSMILALSDTISLLAALYIAMSIRLGSTNYFDQVFYTNFIWVPIPLLLIIFNNNNLYPGIGLFSAEEVRRLSLSMTLLFLLLIALTFLLKSSEIYSRIVFILAWGLCMILVPLNRFLTRKLFVRLKMWGEPVVIIGFPDRRVCEVAKFFAKYPQKGINPKAVFVENPAQSDAVSDCQMINAHDIFTEVKTLRIKTILVVVPDWNWVGENLNKYRYHFPRVILIRQEHESFSLSDSVALDFNGVMGFQVSQNLLNPVSMIMKRGMDIIGSTVALICLSPVFVVISVLIHSGSPGPVFYKQNRVGKGGRNFEFLKFRTMYINGNEIFQAKLKQDKQFRDEWKKYQKVKLDPRITSIGLFLRKFSFDELPQLINILKGEMSLVGPRPIMENQRDMYGPGFHDYSQIRPGLTGLWQVSGRNHTTFARRVEYDLEYIQRWSSWLDMYIIFQTFKEFLPKNGAY